MEKIPKKHKKAKNVSREELLALTKEELADRIIQLEIHNTNLKNIISKNTFNSSKSVYKGKQKKFDYSKSHFRPILLHILYFGWDYQGFVVQEVTSQTIEHHLFNALDRACLVESRETANYHRCGRTDKGVSAYGQVISIKLRSKYTAALQNSPESIANELQYCKILNRLLPPDIRAVGWVPIPEDQPEFSSRFDCKRRQYKYYFPRGSLDIASMKEACALFVGHHDFRNLCKMDVGNGVTEFRRRLVGADVLAVDDNDVEKPTSMYYFMIEGNAFLWHQIRCTVAVLFLIGSGRETKDVISQLLDCKTHDRMDIHTRDRLEHIMVAIVTAQIQTLEAGTKFKLKPQYHMAIDIPLNLFKCSYELPNEWVFDTEELGKVISQLQGDWTIHSIKTTMIKDSIDDLERKFKMATKNSEKDIISYTDCLTTGIKPRVYTPLMKRPTCSSLEERIEHYKRRRKIPDSDEIDFSDNTNYNEDE